MIRSRAMGWALVAFLTVALAGTVAYRGAALVLHRRSLAEWGTEWTETAPRWTPSPWPTAASGAVLPRRGSNRRRNATRSPVTPRTGRSSPVRPPNLGLNG